MQTKQPSNPIPLGGVVIHNKALTKNTTWFVLFLVPVSTLLPFFISVPLSPDWLLNILVAFNQYVTGGFGTSIPFAQYELLTVLLFSGVMVHELGHLVCLKVFHVRLKAFVHSWKRIPVLIGFVEQAGTVTWGQWLIISGAGMIFTIPFLFFNVSAFIILALTATGDLYISYTIMRNHPSLLTFYPDRIVLKA